MPGLDEQAANYDPRQEAKPLTQAEADAMRPMTGQTRTERNAPMTHRVKCWPPAFAEIRSGKKTFELRRNDRDYRVDDLLVLQEFRPIPGFDGEHPPGDFTHSQETRFITSVLRGGLPSSPGLHPDFVILSLRPV